ncbi:uncharacterized protein DS421_2g34850 [Arachis hypogaea]|nr:uncharacterized protein DS421_2g34850 [Arachis hypogaea]
MISRQQLEKNKRERSMARNCASHAIPILMIGVIICFAIIEFHYIIPQRYYTISSNYYIASELELEKCIQRCRETIPEHTITRRYCISRCYDRYGVN